MVTIQPHLHGSTPCWRDCVDIKDWPNLCVEGWWIHYCVMYDSCTQYFVCNLKCQLCFVTSCYCSTTYFLHILKLWAFSLISTCSLLAHWTNSCSLKNKPLFLQKWKQLSRLQRSLILFVLVLLFICGISSFPTVTEHLSGTSLTRLTPRMISPSDWTAVVLSELSRSWTRALLYLCSRWPRSIGSGVGDAVLKYYAKTFILNFLCVCVCWGLTEGEAETERDPTLRPVVPHEPGKHVGPPLPEATAKVFCSPFLL